MPNFLSSWTASKENQVKATNMRSAICMVVKDEIDDIPQWIIHHRLVGFDQIIIYGNGATDGSADLIDAMAAEFHVEHVLWPTPEGRPVPKLVYEDCLRRFGSAYDWIAFLDADEYLVPADPESHIASLLEQHRDHSAIAINWLIFGSSDAPNTNGLLNTETFLNRAEDQFSANRNVKSIIQPSRTIECVNPHAFVCDGPYFTLDNEMVEWASEGLGVVPDGKVVVGSWRIHHYMIRSHDHWRRRLVRGDDSKGAEWDEVFRHHDRNEIEDLTALPLAARVREVMTEREIWSLIETHRTDKSDRRTPVPDAAVQHVAEPIQIPTIALVAGTDLDAEKLRSVESSAVADAVSDDDQLWTQSGLPVAPSVECHLDTLSSTLVRGWAVNFADAETPLVMHIIIDGANVAAVPCLIERQDVRAAGYPSARVGFEFTLERRFFNAQTHRLEFQTVSGEVIRISTPDEKLEFYDFSEKWKPAVRSLVDGMHEGVIKGWVLREEQDHAWLGGCNIVVTSNGTHVANIKANRNRGDVGKAMGADVNCGFEFLPPIAFRKAHPQAFRFFLAPYDIELTGSPYTTSFVSDGNEAALLDLNDTLDRLYVEMTRLRRQVKTMLPKHVHNLSDYDTWARTYLEALRTRVEKERYARSRNLKTFEIARSEPLVSIVCPTWRPKISDFCAAVESVIAQTLQSWELILIDDGSQMPDLTAQIDAFTKRDPRIRVIRRMKNVGISAATNAGMRAARGDWLAFFDHDDLLVPVALELMVSEAQRTGAKLLYSDEDKIDDNGYYSEPAFKTDWNYRLLLGCNYICHLVMLDRATMKQVGFLNPKYNGAQDHDYLLRVSEVLRPDEIHHVPEVLYHWRKSETSTASSTSAKQYAVDAGVYAITDHLARRGKSAEVTSFNDSTWYKVHWKMEQQPKITIIIPYKEQIKTTRTCIDCILAGTDYDNFDVILVDNWSTSEEAMQFSEEMGQLDNVRVLRVEEEFNYSRINNLAARASDAEFFVLMNNDLFVTDKSWLRTILDEALVDEQVGIVGGKFVYPNRRVQHAGVVLGVGGVACHSHSGIGEDEPGYAARALFAQEVSAVTAACLLIRADIYWQVGGLDEQHLAVAFNDVDLCLKVRLAGYKVVWTPEFLAEHHESLSRGSDEIRPEKEARFFHEMQTMIERYGDYLKNDPFYSKHFTLEHRPFFDLRDLLIVPDVARRSTPMTLNPPLAHMDAAD